MYGKQAVPCVGISFGVDRIYTLLDARRKKSGSGSELSHKSDVYIMALGGKDFDGLLLERLKVARELWDVGIQTEFTAKVKPRRQQQLTALDNSYISVILGEDELKQGQVRLKVGVAKDRGRLIARENLVEEVQQELAALTIEPQW
ncbi:hypothetical protein F4777DRAFT_565587 [Nemania sp. FL0916]|nr:hypothetical protein F4777DRAFT_565587 [Nemania sp. FL0916]